MIQRRLAWPLCKDSTQIHEVFYIFGGIEQKNKKGLVDMDNRVVTVGARGM